MRNIHIHNFWKQKFSTPLPLYLPASGTDNATETVIPVPENIGAAVDRMTGDSLAARYCCLLSSLGIVLYKYWGEKELVAAVPNFARPAGDEPPPVFIRMTMDPGAPLKTLLLNCQEELKQAFSHQPWEPDLSGEQEETGKLFQFGITAQTRHQQLMQEDGCSMMIHYAEQGVAPSLSLTARISRSPAWQRQFARHFIQALRLLTTCAAERLADACLLEPADNSCLLRQLQPPAEKYSFAPLQELFVAQAQHIPQAAALRWKKESCTYRELHTWTGRIARLLQTEYSIGSNAVVAVMLPSSPSLMAAILAVLRAGAAFLLIPPGGPAERVAHMLNDSRAKLLIGTAADNHTASMPYLDVKILDDMRSGDNRQPSTVSAASTDPACIIYTSGSTGKPKGVALSHGSLLNMLYWFRDYFGYESSSVLPQKTALTFVDSLVELLLPVTIGKAAVYLRPYDEIMLDPSAYMDWLEETGATIIQFVPSALDALMDMEDTGRLKRLQHIILSGEPVRRKYDLPAAVYNLYGCSEGTASSTIYKYTAEDKALNVIGKPVSNTWIYLLDKDLQLTPPGMTGEIYIGGEGIANGYLHQPELSAARFVADPFHPGKHCYRSGDLGRWLENGNLEHLGRIDDQLKVNGIRMEPAEIAAALMRMPGIHNAFVTMADVNGEQLLTAWLKLEENITAAAIRRFLQDLLPAYMIPACFVRLAEVPLNVNGKADVRKFPDAAANRITDNTTHIEPLSGTEQAIAAIWQKVLSCGPVGRDDNFFDLGGHSLKAMKVMSAIYKELGVQLGLRTLFDAPTVSALSAVVEATEHTGFREIQPLEYQPRYACSRAQKRLWTLAQIEEQHVAYNMLSGYIFNGAFDRAAFDKAFATLIARHEVLRTVFVMIDGEPWQQIAAPDAPRDKVQYVDLSALPAKDRVVRELADKEAMHVFDLEKGPLLRMKLIRMEEHRHIFLFNIHHIISDAWTMRVLVNEILALYDAFCRDEESPLSPLRIQYKDFAHWQNEQLKGEEMNRQRRFWKEQFHDGVPVLELTTDQPRPAMKTYNGDTCGIWIPEAVTAAFIRYTREHDASLFMSLLALLNVLLYRYSGQEDIVIGTPVAGREHKDLEDQLGFYVNTLALRTRFSGTDHFSALLATVRENLLNCYEHQGFPFDQLADELDLARDVRRSPIFDVMAVLHDRETAGDTAAGDSGKIDMEVGGYNTRGRMSKFDLSFSFVEEGSRLFVELEYNTDLFTRSRMESMLQHFSQLAETVVKAEAPLCMLEYLLPDERKQLLQSFNDSARDYPRDKTILDLFNRQVALSPAAAAVVAGDVQLTYAELDDRSDRLALHLSASCEVLPGDRIGMMMARTEQMIVCVLAILKCGGVFVPFDPAMPDNRFRYLAEDSGISLLLADVDLPASIEELQLRVLHPAEALNDSRELNGHVLPGVLPAWPAYIIYTSGSTGMPKGVLVHHDSLFNIAMSWREDYGLDTFNVCLLQLASVAFDVFIGDVCRALLNGGKMVITPADQRTEPESIFRLLTTHRVSIFESTPALVFPLMEYIALQPGGLPHMKVLILGSDICRTNDFNKLLQRFGGSMRILNSYGCTEATIDSSFFEGGAQPLPGNSVAPVGKPMANTSFYILDAHLQLLPAGITGELYIGGHGVAGGYWNNVSLTAERFLDDPFRKGGRMYRTRDLACWTPDGQLRFLGRNDLQVKVKGYRIEPGEIEQQLLQHPGISAAVVVCRQMGDNNVQLAAYITGNEELQERAVRSYLRKQLPDFMVPAYIIPLPSLPYNVNGKVNREALPDPTAMVSATAPGTWQPANEKEQQLLNICARILGRKQVHLDDNFFAIGGDSIKAIQIVAALFKEGQKLNVKDIFQNPEIGSWTACIRHTDKVADNSLVSGVFPLTPVQCAFFDMPREKQHHYNQSVMLYADTGFDADIVVRSFSRLMEHHDMLRACYPVAAGAIVQQISEAVTVPEITVVDLRGQEDPAPVLEAAANRLQSGIDLANGPLVKLGLFHLDEGDCLLIVVHHLVIDGVSWRILFEDLQTLYQALSKGETPSLPAKTDAYKTWASRLAEYANSAELKQEISYWKTIQEQGGAAIAYEMPATDNRIRDTASVFFELDQEATTLLLTQVNMAFRTEINDILLVTLGLGLKEWCGKDKIWITLEGHGREELFDGVDVSRTVGWFTAMYPVLLDASSDDDLTGLIKRTKESLRRIPAKGIGYGILTYLAKELQPEHGHRLMPQISFNYLGQFDADLQESFFEVASGPKGDNLDKDGPREHDIDISGLVADSRLRITIEYNHRQFSLATMNRLCKDYRNALLRLIDFCAGRSESELTPSDFSYKELSIEDLDTFFD